MNRSPARNSLLSRVGAVIGRRQTAKKGAFTAQQVGNSVQLDFPQLELPPTSIHWQQNLNLQHLLNLPRKALSGPVQEDKAEAHHYLKNIVQSESYLLNRFDLRDIYGINLGITPIFTHTSLEELSSSDMCRSIRLISMRDFEGLMERIMPAEQKKQPVQLLTASWLGLNYFWEPDQQMLDFVCAVVYARRRGLPLQRPAQVTRITLNKAALLNLQKHYHVLAMPEDAWTENSFMQYLVNYRVPYARLAIARVPLPIEVLLLPRHCDLSNELGHGLHLAGARDAIVFLLQLCDMDRPSDA